MSDSNETINKEAELAAAEVAAILAAAPTTGSSSSTETASVPAASSAKVPLISRDSSSSNSSLSSMQNDSDQNQAISALTALGDLASSTLRAQTAAAENQDDDDDDDEEEEGAINEDEENDGNEDAQGYDEDDEDEDEEMAEAPELSVPGGEPLAPTNSGMGSSATSLSDDDSLSVLSSPSSEAESLPDEDDQQLGPSTGALERQQGNREGVNAGHEDAEQRPSYDDDQEEEEEEEDEEEGEVLDDDQGTPRAHNADVAKSGGNNDDKGSDSGDYGDSDSSLSYISDGNSDGGRDDAGYGATYGRDDGRASGSAAMMTESPGGTPHLNEDDEEGAAASPALRGDLSGSEMGDDEEDDEEREQEEEDEEEEGAIGSPASNAETEPLPFDDAQQPAQAGEGEEEGQQEVALAAAGALAGSAKDDRDEVATATPQEAMEALTRIEIQFSMLRDRRYAERMEEICRESEMVLQGTHPELIRFTKAIDQLKERKLRLLDMELQKQVAHYEKVGEGEEQVIWNSYRYQAADLRQNMMDDTARKRRRLEREKRLIDAPRPARRHQTFETELVPNPDRQYGAALRARKRELAIADATAAATSLSQSNPEAARKAAGLIQRLQENAVEEDANDYVAYPEVKGLDENELFSDLDRMGILGYGGPGGPMQHYYAAEEFQAAGLDDRAGPRAEAGGGGLESGYPYAPTEASLQGYPMPDHDSAGGGAGPSYSHHARGDRQMPDDYGGSRGAPGGEVWAGHFAGHGGGGGPGSMEAWQAQQQQLQHHRFSPPPQQQQGQAQSSRQHPNARVGHPPQQMQYRSHIQSIPADGGMEDDRIRGGNWGWE